MKSKILFSLLVFLPLTSCHFSNVHQVKALLEDESFVVEKGDIINVSPRKLVHNGEEKIVQGQIIFPDGSSKSGKSFTVTIPGQYSVNYQAIFGTEEVKESLYYNCYRKSGDLFLSSNEDNLPQTGEYSFNTKTSNIQGAKLTLDSKTVFTYDGIIDFNTFSSDEPFLEFMVDTSKQGSSDIESFMVRLTDVDNPNNYVELSITDSGPIDDDGRGCYILAGSNNQFKTGYEFGRLHNTNYGTNVGSSFRALPTDNPARSAKLYLDYSKKALYVSPIINYLTKDIITDLDDKEIYGSMIWEGFKNGKATLSIFAHSLLSVSADVIICRAGGMDLTQMVFEDHIAPVINIDYANQSPSLLPKASINKPYKLFNATVTDNFDKNLSYTTSVTYYDEENNKTKDVSIVNNAFTPDKPGNYEVTYKARDYSNNVSTKVIDVMAIDDTQDMNIHLSEKVINELLYSKIVLPSADDVIVEGGSGKPVIQRWVEDSNKQKMEVDGDIFIPTKIGQYKAFYMATDYIGNISTCVLEINVNQPDKPIFVGDLVLPRVLIKGHSYTLPNYQSVEVINGETVYLDSDVYVNNKKLDDGVFAAEETCNIVYRVSGQTGSNEYPISIDVVDGGSELDQSVYFYDPDNDFVKTENKNDVTLSANHDASALFASVLPYDNPYIKFSVDEATSNFDELLFKFSDHLNPDVSLSFHVTFSGDESFVSVGNNDYKFELSKEENSGQTTYSLDFNNLTRVLSDIAHKELTAVKVDDNNQPFTGFTHGVYLDITMVGVHSESSVKILAISNQIIGHGDIHNDVVSPIIIFNNRFINEQSYGEDAYVPSVEVFDVLSDADVTVTVKGPDGSFKLKNADAKVSNTFKLDSFGSYLVTYRAADDRGNSVAYPRKITVYDFVAPELNVNYNLKAKYAINSKITIPSYTVTDNLNDYTLDIFLILPDDEERLLIMDKNGNVTSYLDANSYIYNSSFKVNANTFRVEQYGRYILRYVAYDTDFNKTVKEYYFEVK